jgi:hypothetical protein
VVDRTNNLLYLRDQASIELQAVCSAGSGSILKEPNGKRTWVFDTPQGQFKVISILKNPIWRKPDWAFIEEGEPIPPTSTSASSPACSASTGPLLRRRLSHPRHALRAAPGPQRDARLHPARQEGPARVVQATRLGTQIYIF